MTGTVRQKKQRRKAILIICVLIGMVLLAQGAWMGFALCLHEVRPYGYKQLELPDMAVPTDIGAMIRIEGGTFMMGAPQGARWRSTTPDSDPIWIELARPQHQEYVRPFEIGKYEVTASEFCAFLDEMVALGEDTSPFIRLTRTATVTKEGDDAYRPASGYEYAPALHVQVKGARRYCEWLSERTGDKYRLPTEIEWEFTARGPEGRTFPWGEESAVGRAFLWPNYQTVCPPNSGTIEVTTVGRFPQGASPEGVHDLIGNASELCGNYFYDYAEESIGADLDRFTKYANPSDDDPEVIAEGFFWPHLPIRGGQYIDTYHAATGWTRTAELARDWGPNEGRRAWIDVSFRVLREVD